MALRGAGLVHRLAERQRHRLEESGSSASYSASGSAASSRLSFGLVRAGVSALPMRIHATRYVRQGTCGYARGRTDSRVCRAPCWPMNFTFSIAVGLAALLALDAPGARAAAPGAMAPDALVKEVSAEVIAVLKQDQAAGRATDVAQLVEKKILPLFDFERMTSTAVGRNWRSASPAQQSALVGEFRTLLVRTYSVSLSSYRDEIIDYKPLRGGAAEGEALVRSSVKRAGAEPLTIDYEMAEDRRAGRSMTSRSRA